MSAEAFAALGLEPGASPVAIVNAYRSRSLVLHPDIPVTGNAAAFTKLNNAYHVALDYARTERCLTCVGTGRRQITRGFHSTTTMCHVCEGSGLRHRAKS